MYPEGLKKRARLLSATDAYESARKKRFRAVDVPGAGEDTASGVTGAGASAADAPKYSQRHVDYFEQVKQAEIARIRCVRPPPIHQPLWWTWTDIKSLVTTGPSTSST